MANIFLSKKIIVPAVIFLGGLLVALGVLILVNFSATELSIALQSEWTQSAGGGISAPASGSSSVSTSCQNGQGTATLNWTYSMHPFQGTSFLRSCSSASITGSGLPSVSGLPCDGSYIFNGLNSNTNYAYTISWYGTFCFMTNEGPDCTFDRFSAADSTGGSFTTPNCAPPSLPGDFNLSVGGGLACNSVPLSWTASSGADGYRILRGAPRVDISPYQPYTALNFTDTNVSQNTAYQYQIEAYNGAGTNRSNGTSVTTPYCSPTLDFSSSPTSIFKGQSTTLTWSTSYVTSCVASGAWSGSKTVNGSEVVIPSPPPSVTYTLTCTGPGGSTGPQSVVVDVLPLALPDWIEIIPR